MKRILAFSVVLGLAGCMSQITQRFDRLNEGLRGMNGKLDEANMRLENIEKSLKKLTGEAANNAPPKADQP